MPNPSARHDRAMMPTLCGRAGSTRAHIARKRFRGESNSSAVKTPYQGLILTSGKEVRPEPH
eukprot:3738032-Pyramimonas_sp.AAC.1